MPETGQNQDAFVVSQDAELHHIDTFRACLFIFRDSDADTEILTDEEGEAELNRSIV